MATGDTYGQAYARHFQRRREQVAAACADTEAHKRVETYEAMFGRAIELTGGNLKEAGVLIEQWQAERASS